MPRIIRVAAIQKGPASTNKSQNVEAGLALLAQAAKIGVDFVVFPELFTTPFWCVGHKDPSYFRWAESIPGPTTDLLAEGARRHMVGIIAPFFERGEIAGEYYNSAVVIDADGNIVPGVMPDGSKVSCYRKNHISDYNWDDQINDEKFYFRPGSGYPVFRTQQLTLGVLICYDRWFPEAWRVLALLGAEVIFLPIASAGYVSEMFTCGLRSNAAAMQIFAVACNKAGKEMVGGQERDYYGLSAIISPDGSLLAQASGNEETVISAALDLDDLEKVRGKLRIYRDRRPELLGMVSHPHPAPSRMEKGNDPQ